MNAAFGSCVDETFKSDQEWMVKYWNSDSVKQFQMIIRILLPYIAQMCVFFFYSSRLMKSFQEQKPEVSKKAQLIFISAL